MRSISMPTLLSSESEEEFASLHAEIEKEIDPKGAIERMYVDDIAVLTWEIRRYHRNKIGIIRNTFAAALQNLLNQLLRPGDHLRTVVSHDPIIEVMASNFFTKQRTKNKIMRIFKRFGLDQSAIEAEAFRLVASELGTLDKMTSNAERRRYKALKIIAQYRQGLAMQLRHVSDRIIAEADVPHLEPSMLPEHGE